MVACILNLKQVFLSSNLSSQLAQEYEMPVICDLALLLRLQSTHSKIIIVIVLGLAYYELAVSCVIPL